MATTTTTVNPPQPYVMTPTGPAMVTVREEPHPATKHKTVFKYLGIVHIVIGVLSILLGGLSYVPTIAGRFFYIGYGIWSGVLYCVLGGIGLSAGNEPNSCNIVSGLAFGIIVSLVAFSVGIAESVVASVYALYSLCYTSYYSTYTPCQNTGFTAIHGTLAALAFVEFVLSIIHSSFCCTGCCGSSSYQGQVMATTTITHIPTGQVPVQTGAQPYYAQQPTQMQGITMQQTQTVPQQPQYANFPAQQQFPASQTGLPPSYQPMQEKPQY